MREVRHRESKLHAQGHTASKWWSRDLNSDSVAPEAVLLPAGFTWLRLPQHTVRCFININDTEVYHTANTCKPAKCRVWLGLTVFE